MSETRLFQVLFTFESGGIQDRPTTIHARDLDEAIDVVREEHLRGADRVIFGEQKVLIYELVHHDVIDLPPLVEDPVAVELIAAQLRGQLRYGSDDAAGISGSPDLSVLPRTSNRVLLLTIDRARHESVVAYIEEKAANAGFVIDGANVTIDSETDPEIVRYISNTASGAEGEMSEIAGELLAAGFSEMPEESLADAVKPGDTAIAFIRRGFENRMHDVPDRILEELGMTVDDTEHDSEDPSD